MAEEVKRHIEVTSSHDDELDAIALCVEAILQIAPATSRVRIAAYIHDRFGAVETPQ